MTAIAVPVQVVWSVTASGQPATATPATPLQVQVAQVHLGLKGDTGAKGDVGDVNPLNESLALQAQAAAQTASQSAQAAALAVQQAQAAAAAAQESAASASEIAHEETTVSMATNLINTQTLLALMIAAQ